MNIEKIKQKKVSSMSEDEMEFLVNHLLSIDEQEAVEYLIDVMDNQLPGGEVISELLKMLESPRTQDELLKIKEKIDEIRISKIELPEFDKKTEKFLADLRFSKFRDMMLDSI